MTGAIDVKRGPGFLGLFRRKNDHNSKSVNSFDSGPIFPPSLGQDVSRNAFVVWILFLGRNPYRSKGFRMTPKIDKNDEISTFREIGQNFGNVLSGEL